MGHKLKQSKIIESRADFFYYAFRNILLTSIPLVIISALIISLPHSSATTSGSDNLSISILPACTIDSVEESSHTATVNAGTHTADIGSTRINAYCNDNNGYSIYAIGSSNNEDGNTDLVNTNISSNYNIHTGIYNENNASSLTVSSWSMKLAAGTGSGNNATPPSIMNNYSNYNVIPNNYTLVASRTSGTNMTIDTDVTGSYFTTTYDVYASSVQPAGTYNGEVKYIMVHPNSNNKNIIPDLNAAFAAAGKQPAYRDENGYYYAMQDMSDTICQSITRTGETTATQLVDLRDQKLYWAARLDDGKCWMTENLDLDIGGTNVAALTSENTDISTNASVYTSSGVYSDYGVLDGVYTWNPASTAVTSNYYLSGTTVKPSTWPTDTIGQTKPYSLEGGEAYVYSSGSTSNDAKYTTLASCATNGRTEAECKRYAIGNFYNWTAAIASNNSTNLGNDPETIAANSICPKGWRLPNASQTDNVNNEFGRMLYKAGITSNLSAGNSSVGYATGGFNKLRSSPYYFVRSGFINGGTLYDPGIHGYCWSSTVSSSTNAYLLEFRSSGIYPASNGNRYSGRSIRCVAR